VAGGEEDGKGLFVRGAYGWVKEELENAEKFDGKTKGYYVAFGWESVEAHMKYRETQAFKDTIPAFKAVAKMISMVSIIDLG
jgi:hypothetical protein